MPFPFNQTDIENLYNQNLDLMSYMLQENQYKAIMDSTFMINHSVQNASLDYQTRVNSFVALNRVILKSELICSSKPQGNNDWVINILYIQK